MQKTISICYVLRNDNYQKHLIERFTFLLNFTLSNIKKLSLLDRFKIIIIDLGSNEPLSKNIFLYDPDFADKVKIYHISQEEINNSKPDKYKLSFFIEKGMNLYLKKLETDYCLTSGQDNCFSTIMLQNLISLIDNKTKNFFKLEDSYFLIPRTIIPFDFILRNPNNDELSKFIERINLNKNNLHPNQDFIGGGFGSLFASKKVWHNIGGFDEDVEGNHSNDQEIYFKVQNNFQAHNLGNFGIISQKMENTQSSDREKMLKNFGPRKNVIKISKQNFLNNQIKFTEHFIDNSNIEKKEKFHMFKNKDIEFNRDDKEQYLINIQRIFYECHFFEKNIKNFHSTLHIIKLLCLFKITQVVRFNSKSIFEIYSICKLFRGIKFISVINSLNNLDKFHVPLGKIISNFKSAFFQPINLDNFDNLNKQFFLEQEKKLFIINQSDLVSEKFFKNDIYQNVFFLVIIKDINKNFDNFFNKMNILYENSNHLILISNECKNINFKEFKLNFLLKNYLKMIKSYLIYNIKKFLKK